MGSKPPQVSETIEAHESRIIGPLRALIFVIILLGIAAALLGSHQMRLFVPVFYLPAGITFVRPRWSQILIWIMWSVTWGMLAMFIAIGGRPVLFTVPSHWLLGSSGALLVVALPLLRWFVSPRSARSAIPEARVHRRE